MSESSKIPLNREQATQNHAAAQAAGAGTYEGVPCWKCGNPVRLTSNKRCSITSEHSVLRGDEYAERWPMAATHKTCSHCGEYLPREHFGALREDGTGTQSRCRACHRARMRRDRYQHVYGLDDSALIELFMASEGACPITDVTLELPTHLRPSGKPLPADGGRAVMHVDHCHADGYVRGVLSSAANAAIGLLGDDPSNALRAAQYLLRDYMRLSGRVDLAHVVDGIGGLVEELGHHCKQPTFNKGDTNV